MAKIIISSKRDWKKLNVVLTKEISKVNINTLKDDTAKFVQDKIQSNISKFQDSGRLAKSFKIRESKHTIVIYSDEPYAEIIDVGGKIRITEKMRKKMWALWYDTKKPVYKAVALTKKSFVTIRPHNYTKIDQSELSAFTRSKIVKQLNRRNNV